MKKLVFVFSVMLSMLACNGGKTETVSANVDTVDTISIDSIDTISVDSIDTITVADSIIK